MIRQAKANNDAILKIYFGHYFRVLPKGIAYVSITLAKKIQLAKYHVIEFFNNFVVYLKKKISLDQYFATESIY